jgi:hypothetical protein
MILQGGANSLISSGAESVTRPLVFFICSRELTTRAKQRKFDVRCSLDTVAKVFSGQQTKIIKTADAFRRRRREGPHRFAQKRPGTFVSGLASIAAVETSKHRLLRDFQRRSIFDFCNSILSTAAIRQGEANVRFVPIPLQKSFRDNKRKL